MSDDFTELLKINNLKRTHAEAALNHVLNKIRRLEAQKVSIEKAVQDARDKAVAQGHETDSNTSFLDIGLLEQWEASQKLKIKALNIEISALQPELSELQGALKILIVREDTLADLSKTYRSERRQAFDDKAAQVTQDLWLTTNRKKSS